MKMTRTADDQAVEPPSRLLERPADGDGPEDRLATLMRRAATPPEGLGAAARERVWRRLDQRERRPRPVASLRWSVAAGVLLTSGVVIGAVSAPRWWPKLRSPRVENAPSSAAAAPRPRALRAALAPATTAPAGEPAEVTPAIDLPVGALPLGAAPAAPSLPTAPEAPSAPAAHVPPAVVAAARGAERPVERAPERTHRAPLETAPAELAPPDLAPPTAVVPAPATPAPPAPSTLANETALLSAALTRLRQHRDAAGALAALDVYDASAPHGTLRREADGARIDALLMLGREADALNVLRTLKLQPRGRDQELRVVRGELTAPISCSGAVEDFDRVLAESPPAPLAERALYGRATCLARLGDATAAGRDRQEYLRRFPSGRFAAEVRRLSQENDL